jgi:TPR repeat protein
MTEPQYDPDLLEGTYLFARSRYDVQDWRNAEKWLSVVVNKKSDYEDATDLLRKAKDGLKRKEYKDGRRALREHRWVDAYAHFQNLVRLGSNEESVLLLLEHAKKRIELPDLYNSVRQSLEYQEELDEQKLEIIIKKLREIVDIDRSYGKAKDLLKWALRRQKAVRLYPGAKEQYEQARKLSGAANWRQAVSDLKEVNQAEKGYKEVDKLIKYAKAQLKLATNYEKGLGYLAHQQWLRAIWCLRKVYRIDSGYEDIGQKLSHAKKGLGDQWKERPFGVIWKKWRRAIAVVWAVIWGGILVIAMALFPQEFATLGTSLKKNIIRSGATPTPTVVIPNIDRIEVLMDGGQLKLDQLPGLTHGEAIVLEVIVFDTNGKRYMSNDLVCKWSVAPLDDEDKGIDTDRCKTLYIPSQEYSSQTVHFEVEGLEQQFKPGESISMKFDIAE